MRLGDLDALKEAINKIIDEEIEIDEKWVKGLKYSLKIIDNAPSVDLFCSYLSDGEVRQPCIESPCKHERPQGEWIRYRDNPHQPEHIKCSNCGQYWSIADHDKTFDFCFKCGAKMKGGAE